MSLLTHPLWQSSDLGQALPPSEHAVSVALPTWKDVIGYEQKSPEVMSKLQNGYPRFVVHKYVEILAKIISPDKPCLPFPSLLIAKQCVKFISQQSGQTAQIVTYGSIFGVITSEAGSASLKAFWQHTGYIISSRQAKYELTLPLREVNPQAKDQLLFALAKLYSCKVEDVFLFPSGMAATYAALRVLLMRRPTQPTVQIGFPYVDTLKLQKKFASCTYLLHDIEKAPHDLVDLLLSQSPAGCFCEIPGNPLLGSVDLKKISPQLRMYGVPLVVDDVVSTPVNIDVRLYADFIATSLTKYATGSGDVMGGALICVPTSPYYKQLKSLLEGEYEDLLWQEDAEVLVKRISSFEQRMRDHNTNGLYIAQKLQNHPAVARVWYPKWEHSQSYEDVRKEEGGWGSLITFLVKDDEHNSAKVYDLLQICKGPSLGTDFTLACPFALLAHFNELDWAESCGIPRNLIRISVGLEDPEQLWPRIATALDSIL